MSTVPRRWDIFCRVIDNFGDIGVSWRLARQLVAECGVAVRLWVDCLDALHALCPAARADLSRQFVDGIEVFRFDDQAERVDPAEVVIEAFGCGLPAAYVSAIAARSAKPLWIVLEYLSAEPWVREHHGLPSPHPQLGLPRYFFFPGFERGTGGVLCERDLPARREAFDADAKRGWWRRMGFDDVSAETLTISLFAYPHAPLPGLLDAIRRLPVPVVLAVPEGTVAVRLREMSGGEANNLQMRFLPFVPQPEYDAILWASDINFVRGEDSFVRAQWAGRPFVWHIYPQAEQAHVAKLDAFLGLYAMHMPCETAKAVTEFWRAWNGVPGASPLDAAFAAFYATRAAHEQGLTQWQRQLASVGGLLENLLRFSQKMI